MSHSAGLAEGARGVPRAACLVALGATAGLAGRPVLHDADAAEALVLAAGATKYDHQPGQRFRVYADPAGHPFCLCTEDLPNQD